MPYILLLSLAINSASVQYSFWTSDHPLSISWPVTFQSLESLRSSLVGASSSHVLFELTRFGCPLNRSLLQLHASRFLDSHRPLLGSLYLGQRNQVRLVSLSSPLPFPAHPVSSFPFSFHSYVSWPRLNPPLEVLNYDGPGFRTTQHGRGFHLKKPRWGKGRAAQVLKGGVDVVQGGLGAVAVGVGAVGGGGGVGDAGLDRRKGRHERLD